MSVLDRRLVEEVAFRLRTDPGLIEKDWHVTQALGVLAGFDHGGIVPAFGGGTSLSKAWGLIQRFSEDIDFKVALPEMSGNAARRERSAYRERIVDALTRAGFVLTGDVTKADESRFFSAEFLFPTLFDTSRGLRPHIKVEMTLTAPALPASMRPLGSLISRTLGQTPEVAAFPCIAPVETASDKMSALAWRVQARRRGSDRDDPTLIRHLHDLAALKTEAMASPEFTRLVRAAIVNDAGRGGEATASTDPAQLLSAMLDTLQKDPLWASEYENFVDAVSFAAPGEELGFAAALDATRDLVGAILK
jgi:hypothetical protein